MGFEPDQPRSRFELVNEFKDRMAQGLEEAKSALQEAQNEYALYYNQRRDPAPDLKVGDMVWLDASDICTTRPSAKLSHCRRSLHSPPDSRQDYRESPGITGNPAGVHLDSQSRSNTANFSNSLPIS